MTLDTNLPPTAGVQRRRMSESERYLHELHGLGGLVAAQVLHIRGPLDGALVRNALAHLQAKFAMLRAEVKTAGLSFRREVPFVVRNFDLVLTGKPNPIPFTETEGDWREILAREIGKPLRERDPRMRVVLVRPGAEGLSRLVLTGDHAVADAKAFALAGRTLMDFLAEPTITVAPSGLPPGLEEAYPRKPDSGRPVEYPIRLPLKPRRGTRARTVVEVRDLSQNETAALHAATRANRTTVHGAISAAILTAVRERYGIDAMTVGASFDFRPLCKPPLPGDTFGSYIDTLRVRHELDQPFWALAREAAFKLIGTVARDHATATIMQMPSLGFLRHEIRPMVSSGFRLDGIGITTGGDFGFRSDYGRFILEDVTMSVAVHHMGPGVFVSSMERNGALSVTLSYTPHIVPPGDAVALANRTAELLRSPPA